jgi:hypothetical protein
MRASLRKQAGTATASSASRWVVREDEVLSVEPVEMAASEVAMGHASADARTGCVGGSYPIQQTPTGQQ